MTRPRPADGTPAVIGVFPPHAHGVRHRLFEALAQAFDVRFSPRGPGQTSALDGAIVFGRHGAGDGPPPAAEVLHYLHGEDGGAPGPVLIGEHPAIDPRLRGRALTDGRARRAEGVQARHAEVLASCARTALWTYRQEGSAHVHVASHAPEELQRGEPLRDRFAPRTFLGLLPLVHLLREVAQPGWAPPPLRAALMIDDPNLHWPTYGYLDFRRARDVARKQGFHLAIATVPLDGWWTHPVAVQLFRDSPELSLLTHGNDHTRKELARERPAAERLAALRQAYARTRRLASRTGLEVWPVMAAAHGSCSAEWMRSLALSDFEALCISRPFPWRSHPPANRPLAAWEPGDWVCGQAVIPRVRLGTSRDDLLLRAVLDQPLIVYGHHNDLAGGLGALSAIAAEINSLGPVHWSAVGEIARTNVATRRDGQSLRVRPYSRRVRVEVPDGVERMFIEPPPGSDRGEVGDWRWRLVGDDERPPVNRRDGLHVRGSGTVELELVGDREARRAAAGAAWPWHQRLRTQPTPVARRLAVEARDRMLPRLPPELDIDDLVTLRPAGLSLSRAKLVARLMAPGSATDHTRSDRDRAEAAARWLCRSHDVTGRRGSSSGFYLLSGWGSAFPETTGYLIGTLLAYGDRYDAPDCLQRAREMGEWEVEIQAPDGGIPQGVIGPAPARSLVFNSGMVIHGWLDLIERDGDVHLLDAAVRAGRFLVAQQDMDGAWRGPHSLHGIPHAYHARAAWALLRLASHAHDPSFATAATRFFEWLLARQSSDGWFEHCVFQPGTLPSTHGLAYTIRGLAESHTLVGDERLLDAALRAARALARAQEPSGRLAGSFASGWRPAARYECATGTVQLGAVWLRLGELIGDPTLTLAGLRAIEHGAGLQAFPGHPDAEGALPGSVPIHGRYAPLSFPNWATKFLLDALLARSAMVARAGGRPAEAVAA